MRRRRRSRRRRRRMTNKEKRKTRKTKDRILLILSRVLRSSEDFTLYNESFILCFYKLLYKCFKSFMKTE